MNEPSRPTPAEPDPAFPAPDPVGDIVPGNPPVPITVWHLPPPRHGDVVPANATRRLAANYTHEGAATVTLLTGAPPDHRGGRHVELVVTVWPMAEPAELAATTHVRACDELLAPDGCLAVVVANSDIPEQLGDLVGAARETGLTYLQHIVIAHHLGPRPTASLEGAVRSPGARRNARGQAGGPRHLRVHTDVLVFRKPGRDADG